MISSSIIIIHGIQVTVAYCSIHMIHMFISMENESMYESGSCIIYLNHESESESLTEMDELTIIPWTIVGHSRNLPRKDGLF